MAKIDCNCLEHLPKAKNKYLGFVAKCISCGDLWYCRLLMGEYPVWKPIQQSEIEKLSNG